MRRLFLILALFAAALATGCANLADAQTAKGSGTARTYDHAYDTVYSAALATVRESGLSLVSENRASGQILAQSSVGLMTYGENVAVFVERQGQRSTRVEIVNKRTLAVNITATNWETRLFEALDRRLGR